MDAVLLVIKLVLVLAFIALGLVSMVLPFAALVSAMATPGGVWESARRNKPLWVLALFVLNILAAVPYWLVVRPHLQRTAGGRP